MDTPQAIRTVSVGGWPLAFLDGSEEPRIRDIDLGERLAYERPRKIRELIARLEEQGKITGVCRRPVVGLRGFAEEIIEEAWLTEEQALWIVTQSETAEAAKLTGIMIRVFRLALRGELPTAPALPAAAVEQGASMLRLAADALDRGEAELARRYQGAAYMLIKAPKAPRAPKLPKVAAEGPAPGAIAVYRDRLLATVRKAGVEGVPTLRALIWSTVGNHSALYAVAHELLTEGALARDGHRVKLAPGEALQ
jgi:hypothetical protein